MTGVTAPADATSVHFEPVDPNKPYHVCPYPNEAMKSRLQGVVRLAFRIRSDGSVTKAKVTRSSGYSMLDNAALTCVKTWRYNRHRLQPKSGEIPWLVDVHFDVR